MALEKFYQILSGRGISRVRPNYEWDQIDCVYAAREKNTILADSDRLEARNDTDLRYAGSQDSWQTSKSELTTG